MNKYLTPDKNGFIYPLYEDYCFSNIPSTIKSFFGIEDSRPRLPKELYGKQLAKIEKPFKVILFLIDGLGYRLWQKNSDIPLLSCLNNSKTVFPITTVFPSTTAATLNTMNSGVTPSEHGLPEWFSYIPEIDKVIETLPFRNIGDNNFDTLTIEGVNPSILFKGRTIFEIFKRNKIKTRIFINKNYMNTAYSMLMHKGAKTEFFVNGEDLFNNLQKSLEEENFDFYFVYWDRLDSICHKLGPYTKEVGFELSLLSNLLMGKFLENLSQSVSEKTLLLITADHGQITVDPTKTIYLNNYPSLIKNFKISKNGKAILPSGSARDTFLHIKEERFDETFEFLIKEFKDIAKIMKIEEAEKLRLFGKTKSKNRLLGRVGNLLILPYKNNTIWFEHLEGRKLGLKGLHGGLSFEEMVIPMVITKLSDIKI